MYFWNAEQLAQALRQNSVSQAVIFKSFLFVTVLSIVQVQISFILNFNTNYSFISVAISALLNIIFAIVGITWMHSINESGDGVNFLERYICLSVPISIQILVLNLALYIIYLFVLGSVDKFFKEYVSLQVIANGYYCSQFLTIVYFFILMRRFLRHVSNRA